MNEEETMLLAGRLIEGTSVFVPSMLMDKLEHIFERTRSRERAAQIWSLIANAETFESGPVAINNQRFLAFGGRESVNNAKKGLEAEGLIGVGPSYEAGVRPKTYSTKQCCNPVELQLVDDWSSTRKKYTEDDEACKHTRETLDMLEVDVPRVLRLLTQMVPEYLSIAYDEGKLSTRSVGGRKKKSKLYSLAAPITSLIESKGRVSRSRTCKRLFSPLTNLKTEFRSCLSIEGDPLAYVDMVCAQPTFLACLSSDEKLLRACQEDHLYDSIGELFNVTRKEAKGCYYQYIFGRNRKDRRGNRTAFEVQEFFKEKYPRAADFAWDAKKENHRRLSHKLQRMEAELFVDGMLLELKRLNVPALTIHDSIVVGEQDREQAMGIAQRILSDNGIRPVLTLE